MSLQRLSGSQGQPVGRVPVLEKTRPSVDMLKVRLLLMLNDQFDAGKLQRMPASLVRETARRQLRQTLESEAPRMAGSDRDRLIDEILGDAFGFGPLEELFADPGVSEIAILGPFAVIARRADGWLPTNVKFRDIEHVVEIIDKVRSQGETIGSPLPESMVDVKLNNGFRTVAVVPVSSVGVSPTAAFVRLNAPPPAPPQPETAAATESSLDFHRARIHGRIRSMLANLGARDLSRIDVGEVHRIVAAYVEEYCIKEQVRLSEPDQTRLISEILESMGR